MPDEDAAPRDAPTSFETPVEPLPPPVPIPSAEPDPGYTDSGVPTFDSVREKIETRYGTAAGATELDSETAEAHPIEQQYEERQKAAAERLAQIRESMQDKNGDG